MSTNEQDENQGAAGGRVIPVTTGDDGEAAGGDESLALSPSPEMEAALQEALESVEKKSPKRGLSLGSDMARQERENFQNRIRELHIQLMEKTKELEAANERILRAQAELENFKKRVQKDKADQFNYGHENIARDFLEVLDNLNRAVEHAESEPSSLLDGVKLTRKNMEQVFERHNVVPIKALGEKFDPNYHQAVAQVYRDDVEPGTVVEEHQRGFMLKDRLLRPSMVVVSARPPGTSETNDTDDENDTNTGARE